MCHSSFFVRPFWNPWIITTELENDKKSGEVWAVLPNNRLFMLLHTANCKTCYDGVTCTVPVFVKICSASSAFLYLAAEIGSRARVRNCVRFQNRGNSCRASLEIWYSLASCTPPHLSRTMEFRALRWRNFSQAKRKRDSEDVPFCGVSSYRRIAILYRGDWERCYGITSVSWCWRENALFDEQHCISHKNSIC